MLPNRHKTQILNLYQTALSAVSGEHAVARYLKANPLPTPCSVVAIGKAAASMAMGAQRVLGEGVRSALVITKHGHTDPRLDPSRITQLESAHPVPDESSLAAGRALLDFLETLPDDEPLLFLLSGGASALVEVLPEGRGADELADMNRRLLASGVSISEMNAQRRAVSQIKGGRLIPHLRGRPCLQLLISDVPGDDIGVIGSAPLIGEGGKIESHIIASNDLAREALIEAARQQGLTVHDHPGHFEGEAGELAAQFCDELLNGPVGLYLWGGESSVVLPEHPGRGGRNQQLALAAARYLAGHENVLLLAAGTDGSDGPTEDAGALVDGGTVQRGAWEGLSAPDALEAADAGTFLEASGDLVQTGPTGTNVMDLVIAWKW
jgi:glycerate 2-kinase